MIKADAIPQERSRSGGAIMNDQTNRLPITDHRALLEEFIRAIPIFPEETFQGRGIVLCGGGSYFPCVWVCIKMLRLVGCSLPIELWYRGPGEMTAEMKTLLQPFGVVCRDAFAESREFPVRSLDGWELKPYAILHSRFAEVLYIDADNVAVRDPEYLFKTDEYLQYGALFWPDLPFKSSDDRTLYADAWRVMDVPFRSEPEFEAGQMVIDKRRCWAALQLTLHLNEHSDYYYRVFFGDKDTFHLAWRKLQQDYGFIARAPVALGENLVLIQVDPAGERLFQHRCNAKWTLIGSNERIRGFLFEEECLAYLQELRTLWPVETGRVLTLTPSEQKAFDELTRVRVFDCLSDERLAGTCSICSDWTLSIDSETHDWELEEDHNGEAVLILVRAGRRLCFLRRTARGSWRGLWRYAERRPLEFRRREGHNA